MSALAQGGVMVIAGVIVFRTVLVEGHLNYVRPGLGLPLLLGAAVVTLIGVASLWSAVSARDGDGPGDVSRHPSGHSPKVGWLLLVPMLALISTPQVPLGSFAAGRGTGRSPVRRATLEFAPLPEPRGGAVDLSLTEFVSRAAYAPGSLEDERVRLVGFVAPDREAPSGWMLTRFSIGCCAADAFPMQVAVENETRREADQWMEVVGMLRHGAPHPAGTLSPPKLAVIEARPVPPPNDPYEF